MDAIKCHGISSLMQALGAETKMKSFWQQWRSGSLRDITHSWIKTWWQSLDKPLPWPEELDTAVREPDAIPVCHRCTTPCELPEWFCPNCGAAIGPYNNTLPFIYIFSIGEVLRSGVSPSARYTALTIPGYILAGIQWGGPLFGPLYYIRILVNAFKIRKKRRTQQDAAD